MRGARPSNRDARAAPAAVARVDNVPMRGYNLWGAANIRPTAESARPFGDWCNGSTTDSGSVSLGSNPRSPALEIPSYPAESTMPPGAAGVGLPIHLIVDWAHRQDRISRSDDLPAHERAARPARPALAALSRPGRGKR